VGIAKADPGFMPDRHPDGRPLSKLDIGRIGRQGLADFPACTE
jgi:hypothetical protein